VSVKLIKVFFFFLYIFSIVLLYCFIVSTIMVNTDEYIVCQFFIYFECNTVRRLSGQDSSSANVERLYSTGAAHDAAHQSNHEFHSVID